MQHINLVGSREAIQELLDFKSARFNILRDFGEIDGALSEYDRFLDEVAQLPHWWQRVITDMAREHPEMDRFMQRMEKVGLEETLALKGILEKQR